MADGTYKDLARFRALLQPRRRVDAGPNGHPLPLAAHRIEIDQHLPRLHAGPDRERRFSRPRADALGTGLRGSERPQGIVRVRGRRAEEGEHRITDELLDDAAVLQDSRAQLIEGAGEQPLHALRPERDGEVCRADGVDEEARDDAALGVLGCHYAVRSTRTFITGPPRSARSMPSWSPSSGILWLTNGPTGTAPEAARRIASSQSARE